MIYLNPGQDRNLQKASSKHAGQMQTPYSLPVLKAFVTCQQAMGLETHSLATNLCLNTPFAAPAGRAEYFCDTWSTGAFYSTRLLLY